MDGAILWRVALLLVLAAAAPLARADAISVVQELRAGGCGGRVPLSHPLNHNTGLDRVAANWAAGGTLAQLAPVAGFGAGALTGVHVSVREAALLETLSRGNCQALSGAGLTDIGQFQRPGQTWLVLAGSHPTRGTDVGTWVNRPPVPGAPAAATGSLGQRAIELVNEVRARGTRCGSRTFAPAPPVTLSGTLAGVAQGHASDMALHNYFEHVDPAGQSPADRVRAAGYAEKLVGENIAYGAATLDEVMRGWLQSPGHCENIMDPRFAQMGLALATGYGSRRGLYWVQLFAQPRA